MKKQEIPSLYKQADCLQSMPALKKVTDSLRTKKVGGSLQGIKTELLRRFPTSIARENLKSRGL